MVSSWLNHQSGIQTLLRVKVETNLKAFSDLKLLLHPSGMVVSVVNGGGSPKGQVNTNIFHISADQCLASYFYLGLAAWSFWASCNKHVGALPTVAVHLVWWQPPHYEVIQLQIDPASQPAMFPVFSAFLIEAPSDHLVEHLCGECVFISKSLKWYLRW